MHYIKGEVDLVIFALMQVEFSKYVMTVLVSSCIIIIR